MKRSAHKPTTVLYFSSFAHSGWGGQESLLHLVSRLDRREFRPIVVLPHAGSLAPRLAENRVDMHLLALPKVNPANMLGMIQAGRRLLTLVSREGVDLLHTDGPRNTFYAGLAGRLAGKPVLWHARSSSPDRYDPLLGRLCTRIILVADDLRDRFQCSGLGRKLITIHNGVDVDHFIPGFKKQKIIGGTRFRPDDTLVTVCARIEKLKGQRYLIEARGALRHLRRRVHLLFAGAIVEKDYHRECVERARELGVCDDVHFLGHVEDVKPLLQETDIFVLPSIQGEAFPRSVLEAMSTAVPVVATDCGGTREAVADGVCGFLVPPYDSRRLAESIARLAHDGGLRCRMGQAGRKIVIERFAIERNVSRTEEVYREIHDTMQRSASHA
jgi:glycosyltransferase involved in cell wall biosynthesis